LSTDYFEIVIADLEPPKDNSNAPYVLTEQSPRYRTPFTKETAAAYGRKGGLTRGRQLAALAQFGRNLKGQVEAKLSASLPELQPKVESLRRAQQRFLAQAVAENDARKQSLFMRSYREAFDAEQTLLGHSHKSTKKPHLAGLPPSAKVEPLPSGNQGVNPSTIHPASEQAPIAPVSPSSPATPDSDSDCPF